MHTYTRIHLGIAEIKVNGLGMSNVKDSIGFRGEPGDHLQ